MSPIHLVCPYNPSHVIMKSRIQTHLVKCEKQHPQIKLETCPFDITHRFRKEDKDVSHSIQLSFALNFFDILKWMMMIGWCSFFHFFFFFFCNSITWTIANHEKISIFICSTQALVVTMAVVMAIIGQAIKN